MEQRLKRIAIFVDAGYLYAQGSACLQGSKAKRELLHLDHGQLIAILKQVAESVQRIAPLLRIYWYDGSSRGPTPDHRLLADFDDLKLRLGFINSVGQQKGVDSLLVTDLVELARNGAICDAVLLGGDEDLRIGVQIAQSFGVRVHLLGIEPARASQSLQLRQEVDTKQELTRKQIEAVLTIVSAQPVAPVLPVAGRIALPSAPKQEVKAQLDQVIEMLISQLRPSELKQYHSSIQSTSAVPAELDRRLLASCRTAIGRDLIPTERSDMRKAFLSRLRSLDISTLPTAPAIANGSI